MAMILVAEKDHVTRRLLEVTLEKWGYDVVSTDDSRGCVEYLESIKVQKDYPDAIIIETDGDYKPVQFIRNNKKYQQIPVVILSKSSQKSDMIKGIELGAFDYITKPFDAQ